MFSKKKSLLIFLLPGLMVMTIFYIFPFVGGMFHSLTDGTYSNGFVGFENYKKIWNNEMFLLGLRNTLELSLICTPLLWSISFLIAFSIQEYKIQAGIIHFGILLPYMMPSSTILLIWSLVFDYGGPLNRIIVGLGMERVMWMESAELRVPIILMFLWRNLGFCVTIFMASLQTIPRPYYEYAEIEGAGFLTKIMQIALPIIQPTAYFIFVLSWINSFKIFKEVYFIAGAYPDYSVYTLQHYLNNMFTKLDYQNVTTAAYSFAAILFLAFGLIFVTRIKSSENLY